MILIDVIANSKKWLAEKDIEKFIQKTCKKIVPLTDLKKILKKNVSTDRLEFD